MAGDGEAEDGLAGSFENKVAPWVLELGLRVETVVERGAVLWPWSGRLSREGGGLSGQALMEAGRRGPRGRGTGSSR